MLTMRIVQGTCARHSASCNEDTRQPAHSVSQCVALRGLGEGGALAHEGGQAPEAVRRLRWQARRLSDLVRVKRLAVFSCLIALGLAADVCVDTGKVSADTCLAWKTFGFCYPKNKAMEWCCATCKSDKVWPGSFDEAAFAAQDAPAPTKTPIADCLQEFTNCQADAHNLKAVQKCSRAFHKCKFGFCHKVCKWEQTKCHASADTKEKILGCKSLWKPCMTKNGC